jgi:hypothetical protein
MRSFSIFAISSLDPRVTLTITFAIVLLYHKSKRYQAKNLINYLLRLEYDHRLGLIVSAE